MSSVITNYTDRRRRTPDRAIRNPQQNQINRELLLQTHSTDGREIMGEPYAIGGLGSAISTACNDCPMTVC